MKYIGLILTILICTIGHAQEIKDRTILVSNVPLPAYIGGTFTQDYFFDGRNRYDSIHETGLCWLKIRLMKDLSLTGVEVSPGTNSRLVDYFKQTLLETKGKWKVSNELQIRDSLIIIIPVSYGLIFNNGKQKIVTPHPWETVGFLSPSKAPTRTFIYPQITCANYFIEPGNNDDVVPQKTSGDTMNQKIFMSKFMITH